MCHLFAISSSTPTTIAPFAAAIAPLSEDESPDGWGLAAIDAGRTTLVKEPHQFAAALRDESAAVVRALRTPGETILFHLRERSVGKNTSENTHPFRRHFLRRSYLFMHNGTAPDVKKLPLSRLERAGETDSEHAFLWFLEAMPPVPPRNLARWLKGESDLIRRLGRFNFVMAEGDTLWAYADDAMHYAMRTEVSSQANPPAQLQSRARAVRRGPLTLMRRAPAATATRRRATHRRVLIATRPFTAEDEWHELPSGSLTVMRAGRIVEILQ